MMRLEDDRVLAPEPWQARRLGELVGRLGERHGVVAWRAADTHLHVVVDGAAGACAQALGVAVKRRLEHPVGIRPTRVVPVQDQQHLRALIRYVLRQEHRHGVALDPWHEASVLPDLFGARLTAPYAPGRLRRLLPRLRREDLLGFVELSDWQEAEPDPLADLADLASAAFGTDRLTPSARAAAVHASARAARDVAEALRCSPRTVWELRARPPDPAAVRAIRLQAGLRTAKSGEVSDTRLDFSGDRAESRRSLAVPDGPTPVSSKAH